MLKRRHILLFLTLGGTAACAAPERGEVRRFSVENRFELDIPEGGDEVRAWFALPDDREELQRVDAMRITVTPERAGISTREVRDADGNRFLYLEASDAGGEHLTVATAFELTREEARANVDPRATRAPTARELRDLEPYLAESSNIVITDRIRAIADEVTGTEENPIRAARLVYDWVLDNVTYWVKFPGSMKSSSVGSSEYCLEQGCGNCTDFHSLYAAVARAAGVPTRMVYGSFFKGPLNGVDRDQSYHCWIEFWAPEVGWIPLDVAVADIFVDDFTVDAANREGVSLTVADGYAGPDPGTVEYYFGNLDARRVTWNLGRDLALDPPNASGPVNALPKALVEVDGATLAEQAGWTRKLTFQEL